MSVKGRRDFLKIFGIGAGAAAVGGVGAAKVLASQAVEEGNEKVMAHWRDYRPDGQKIDIKIDPKADPKEIAAKIRKEIRQEFHPPAPWSPMDFVYKIDPSKELERHLLREFSLVDEAPGALPKTVTTVVIAAKKLSKKSDSDMLDFGERFREQVYTFDHLYEQVCIRDASCYSMDLKDAIKTYVDPMILSLANVINKHGYRFAARLPNNGHTGVNHSAVYHAGTVPLRANITYDAAIQGHRFTLEAYVA